jgi:hypothetical protein
VRHEEEDGMNLEKGKGLGATWLLGCGLAALGASAPTDAALVTLSGVFTNTTGAAVEKEFSHKIIVTETITNVGAFGSLSIVVTDFNRNGASVTAAPGVLYSGWINGAQAKSFAPANAPGGGFALTAAARSLATFDSSYGSSSAPQAIASVLNANDEIEVRLKFTVSAGDQVAYSATFNLVAVPGPSAACAALLAPWIGLHRRRRTENDS